jgi:hypothetical protein
MAVATGTISGWAGSGQARGRRRRWRFRGVGCGSEGAEWAENGQVWLPRGSRGAKSYVNGSAGTPNSGLPRRGRHGVAGDFIGLRSTPAIFGARRCEPKNVADAQIAIGIAIGCRRRCSNFVKKCFPSEKNAVTNA